jgi:putative inorganic carbon (hco3(-)) transporter
MVASTVLSGRREAREQMAGMGISLLLTPLQWLMAWPDLLFLAALTAMLLRPSDVQFYAIDRVAFALLVVGVGIRALVQANLRLPERTSAYRFAFERATWPMLALTALTLGRVAGMPFDSETWSLLGAKIIVPFVLFHVAGVVFFEERAFLLFEMFSLAVLAYLSFTAIAFLVDARSLIFPRFILDDTLGYHADRARGPFLQAVANGVSLNLLGLLALHAYRRGRVRGAKMALLLASVPIAILATMTRAVWLAFGGTVAALIFRSGSRTLRRACAGLVAVLAIGLVVVLSSPEMTGALSDRLQERGPVDYRQAVYAGGWQMFLERPWLGWGFHRMPGELPRFVSGYSEKELFPHNTYLELLVEEGLLGLGLFAWLIWELWRLKDGAIPERERGGFLDRQFHRLWPLLLLVYLVNASVVVMSYQFVNGFIFTIAGMLAAQRRRAKAGRC